MNCEAGGDGANDDAEGDRSEEDEDDEARIGDIGDRGDVNTEILEIGGDDFETKYSDEAGEDAGDDTAELSFN